MLQSMGSQRVRQELVTEQKKKSWGRMHNLFTCMLVMGISLFIFSGDKHNANLVFKIPALRKHNC